MNSSYENIFKVIEIEINSNCNMSCSYCPNSILERIEKGQMNKEVFYKIVKSLEEVNYTGLVSFHFYNEPLLSPNLLEFTKYLKLKVPNCILQVYTNGKLLSIDLFRSLVSVGVDGFKVTKHKDINTKYLFDEVFEMLDDSEKKRVIYNTYRDLDLTNRAGILTNINNKIPKHTPCFLPSVMMVITLKGNVLPCYEDFKQTLTMGNVCENTLLEIWQSEKFNMFRDSLRVSNGRQGNSTCINCNNFNLPSINKL